MVIKSQQDIKKETAANREKIPKSMEKLAKQKPQIDKKNVEQASATYDALPVDEKISEIENYLESVNTVINQNINDINILKSIIKELDSEVSRLTGDLSRLTKLNEDRYVEVATAFNALNHKVKVLDEGIPKYVADKLDAYFTEEPLETYESPEKEQPES